MVTKANSEALAHADILLEDADVSFMKATGDSRKAMPADSRKTMPADSRRMQTLFSGTANTTATFTRGTNSNGGKSRTGKVLGQSVGLPTAEGNSSVAALCTACHDSSDTSRSNSSIDADSSSSGSRSCEAQAAARPQLDAEGPHPHSNDEDNRVSDGDSSLSSSKRGSSSDRYNCHGRPVGAAGEAAGGGLAGPSISPFAIAPPRAAAAADSRARNRLQLPSAAAGAAAVVTSLSTESAPAAARGAVALVDQGSRAKPKLWPYVSVLGSKVISLKVSTACRI